MNPVAQNPKKFGKLLKMAVRKVALLENKNISVVQDELGFALGRDTGGASIQFWERGNVPAQADDVIKLKQELLQQGGLTAAEGVQFSACAGLSELEEEPTTAFIAGPPITHPRHFFGREYELKRLFDLWQHTTAPMQNAAVIGLRGSGKTSLLFYLKSIAVTPVSQLRPGQRTDWLPQSQRYRWVFVDFRNPQLGTQAGLLRYLLACLELPAPDACSLERFVEIMSRDLNEPAIVLLDGIGVALERYDELDDTFWDGLRALASTLVRGNLAFVLSARQLPYELAQRHNRSSDFFSIFAYTGLLGPLKETEARQLIASSPIPFPADDVDWILNQSQRWPLLIQILSRERLLTLQEGNEGTEWREEGLRQLVPFQYLLT
jgi:hypothetical protein